MRAKEILGGVISIGDKFRCASLYDADWFELEVVSPTRSGGVWTPCKVIKTGSNTEYELGHEGARALGNDCFTRIK